MSTITAVAPLDGEVLSSGEEGGMEKWREQVGALGEWCGGHAVRNAAGGARVVEGALDDGRPPPQCRPDS
jgi:hypothetical protein